MSFDPLRMSCIPPIVFQEEQKEGPPLTRVPAWDIGRQFVAYSAEEDLKDYRKNLRSRNPIKSYSTGDAAIGLARMLERLKG